MSLLPSSCIPDNDKAFHLSVAKYPYIDVFESIADDEDCEVLNAIVEIGIINDINNDSDINSLSNFGAINRFSNGTFPLFSFYTDIELALLESKQKLNAFLQSTNESNTEISLQLYVSKIVLPLHDLRAEKYHSLLFSSDFKVTQKFVGVLRQQSSLGLLFNTSENERADSGYIFNKKALSVLKKKQCYRFCWQQKQQKISHVFSLKEQKI